jgi:hypothetical protein
MASATVTQTVTSLSGLSGTISFPADGAGTTPAVANAENYTVSTTDASGYTLMLVAGSSDLTTLGSDAIPNTALTITETRAHPGSPGSQTLGSASGALLTLGSTNSVSGDVYAENWALALPSNAAAGTYEESFLYLLLGN